MSEDQGIWMPAGIETVDLDTLRLPDENARSHDERQLNALVRSMRTAGVTTPLVVDATNYVVSGSGRYIAMRMMGVTHGPVVRADHLSEPQARAFALLDNRIADMSDWDDGALTAIMESLTEEMFEDFGFSALFEGMEGRMDEATEAMMDGFVGTGDGAPAPMPEPLGPPGEALPVERDPEDDRTQGYTCPYCGHDGRYGVHKLRDLAVVARRKADALAAAVDRGTDVLLPGDDAP